MMMWFAILMAWVIVGWMLWVTGTFCYVGIHNWKYTTVEILQGRLCRQIRYCMFCGKEQRQVPNVMNPTGRSWRWIHWD